jgi:hypothetical protein
MKRKNLKDIQNSGFKVPVDYFQNFENSILSQASLNEKFSDSGFTVPQGYFDAVEEQILSQVSLKEPVKVIPLISKKAVFYVSSIAAALVLMFSVINFNSGIDIDSIETASIENYLNNEDIYSDELIALLNDTNFLDYSFNDISFSEEAIEDYVNDNLELNDLYIE